MRSYATEIHQTSIKLGIDYSLFSTLTSFWRLIEIRQVFYVCKEGVEGRGGLSGYPAIRPEKCLTEALLVIIFWSKSSKLPVTLKKAAQFQDRYLCRPRQIQFSTFSHPILSMNYIWHLLLMRHTKLIFQILKVFFNFSLDKNFQIITYIGNYVHDLQNKKNFPIIL